MEQTKRENKNGSFLKRKKIKNITFGYRWWWDKECRQKKSKVKKNIFKLEKWKEHKRKFYYGKKMEELMQNKRKGV